MPEPSVLAECLVFGRALIRMLTAEMRGMSLGLPVVDVTVLRSKDRIQGRK